MYQATVDVADHNINAWQYLYASISDSTDWCILVDRDNENANVGDNFRFPEGYVIPRKRKILGNFYYSSYRCPNCGQALYKTAFREGVEPYLQFNDVTHEGIKPARIFTCPDCLFYYAAPQGYRLLDGRIIATNFSKADAGLNLYNMWFTLFNEIGNLNIKRNC